MSTLVVDLLWVLLAPVRRQDPLCLGSVQSTRSTLDPGRERSGHDLPTRDPNPSFEVDTPPTCSVRSVPGKWNLNRRSFYQRRILYCRNWGLSTTFR